MKKLNVLGWIVGIVCILIGGYIVYNKLYTKEEVNFNKEDEVKLVSKYLNEVGTPLGWLIISNGIDNQSEDGTSFNISYGKDLLEDYYNKQLFTMEYILSYKDNHSKFTVLSGFDQSVVEEEPTSDFTISYLKYDEFNEYYKKLFGDDFDIKKAQKGNTSYDKDYVYYFNRKAGSNGIYVSMVTCSDVEYEDNLYKANVKVTYSTRAAEKVGTASSNGIITYTKDINNNIILNSFSISKD